MIKHLFRYPNAGEQAANIKPSAVLQQKSNLFSHFFLIKFINLSEVEITVTAISRVKCFNRENKKAELMATKKNENPWLRDKPGQSEGNRRQRVRFSVHSYFLLV